MNNHGGHRQGAGRKSLPVDVWKENTMIATTTNIIDSANKKIDDIYLRVCQEWRAKDGGLTWAAGDVLRTVFLAKKALSATTASADIEYLTLLFQDWQVGREESSCVEEKDICDEVLLCVRESISHADIK